MVVLIIMISRFFIHYSDGARWSLVINILVFGNKCQSKSSWRTMCLTDLFFSFSTIPTLGGHIFLIFHSNWMISKIVGAQFNDSHFIFKPQIEWELSLFTSWLNLYVSTKTLYFMAKLSTHSKTILFPN